MSEITKQQPAFIRVFSETEQVHLAIPVSFIKSVGPLYKMSEVLEDHVPVKGNTLINMMDSRTLPIRDKFDDVMKALGCINVTDEATVTEPGRVQPIDIAAEIILPGKKH